MREGESKWEWERQRDKTITTVCEESKKQESEKIPPFKSFLVAGR